LKASIIVRPDRLAIFWESELVQRFGPRKGAELFDQIATVPTPRWTNFAHAFPAQSAKPLQCVREMPTMTTPGAPNIQSFHGLVTQKAQTNTPAAALASATSKGIVVVLCSPVGLQQSFAAMGARFVYAVNH